MSRRRARTSWLVPEVVQTSAVDCGPAALKAMLEGFGIPVSYGRLREACQTSVDGTSFDRLEEVAEQLGLEVDKTLMPVDHLLFPGAEALPAVVVVRLPNGFAHFVVIWRRHGRWLMLMDPAGGRRWVTVRAFLNEVYTHSLYLPAEHWRSWIGAQKRFHDILRGKLRALGIGDGPRRLKDVLEDPGWRPIAAFDASLRMLEALVDSGGIARGAAATRALDHFFTLARPHPQRDERFIPEKYWSAVRTVRGAHLVKMRGVPVLRVLGVKSRPAAGPARRAPLEGTGTEPSPGADADPPRAVPRELIAALTEAPFSPGRQLWALLQLDGVARIGLAVATLALLAAGAVLEGLLLRGLLDGARELRLPYQRDLAALALALLFLGLIALDLPSQEAILGLGRRLEVRLRLAVLRKIPRLGDQYFSSRPSSDMADRVHLSHLVRDLPTVARFFLLTLLMLVFTTLGLIWLDPSHALWALSAAVVAALLPVLSVQPLLEQDLRVRVHVGALGRFYLDALLGLVPIRTHGGERAVRREHEALLVRWARASWSLARTAMAVELVQAIASSVLAVVLLRAYLGPGVEVGSALLAAYWALNLPILGQDLAIAMRAFPSFRNITLRLVEPLGALETVSAEPEGASAPERVAQPLLGRIEIEDVSVVAGGQTILSELRLAIAPGEHVAIVGASGAGKSSLVGLLLGWLPASAGRVLIDGRELDGPLLASLRQQTAWVDPAVHLYNRSLVANLLYGAPAQPSESPSHVLDAAGLRRVLERLPAGLQTSLGEGGGLVSGGEGQRVRLGRALFRRDARLVILDEPFRGLDRSQRRELAARARSWWSHATLLCVTHDVAETSSFARVLVVDGGRVVEDGAPATLAAAPSRYRALLDAELELEQTLWSHPSWTRLRVEGGSLSRAERA